jgi:putative transposase
MKYIEEENKIHACSIQVVFCTKYCKPVLENKVKDVLNEVIIEVAKKHSWIIHKLEINSYYVYLHIQFSPRISIHRVIKTIKSKSSNVLRKTFKELVTKMPSIWTRSYLVSTENLDSKIVEEYIKRQKNI